MLFNSYAYPPFLFTACAGYWLLPARWRPWFLVGAGMAFYALHDVGSLALVLALSVVVYAALRPRGTRFLPFAIALVIGALATFKYGGMASAGMIDLAMPIGISFFTFEFLHLLVDRRRGTLDLPSPRDFAAFVFFFPSLLAGPIRRFQEFAPFLRDSRMKPEYLYWGIGLLAWGYAQKYLLADPLIPFTRTLAHPEALASRASAVGGLFLYSFRIYFDFAGLSNIAIGSALLFGIPLPRNFRSPYLSGDIQQFWRRWHMSLGDWVRDYIYIPLGGSRVALPRQMLNLTIAMTIVGLWHGAGWNFAAWGLWHGVGLSARLAWTRACPWRMPRAVGTVATFSFVTLGWAFFVTDSFADSMLLLSRIFGTV